MTDDFLDASGGYLKSFARQYELYTTGKICYAFISYTREDTLAAEEGASVTIVSSNQKKIDWALKELPPNSNGQAVDLLK